MTRELPAHLKKLLENKEGIAALEKVINTPKKGIDYTTEEIDCMDTFK